MYQYFLHPECEGAPLGNLHIWFSKNWPKFIWEKFFSSLSPTHTVHWDTLCSIVIYLFFFMLYVQHTRHMDTYAHKHIIPVCFGIMNYPVVPRINHPIMLSYCRVCVCVCVWRVELGDRDWLIIWRLTSSIVRAAPDRDYTHTHTHARACTEVTHKNKLDVRSIHEVTFPLCGENSLKTQGC